jgi:hypothetical protein
VQIQFAMIDLFCFLRETAGLLCTLLIIKHTCILNQKGKIKLGDHHPIGVD